MNEEINLNEYYFDLERLLEYDQELRTSDYSEPEILSEEVIDEKELNNPQMNEQVESLARIHLSNILAVASTQNISSIPLLVNTLKKYELIKKL